MNKYSDQSDYHPYKEIAGISIPTDQKTKSKPYPSRHPSLEKINQARVWKSIFDQKSQEDISKGCLVTQETELQSFDLLTIGLVISKGKRVKVIFARNKGTVLIQRTKLFRLPDHIKLATWKNKLTKKYKKLEEKEKSRYNLRSKGASKKES